MTIEPVIAAIFGGWEIILILGVLGFFGLVAVGIVVLVVVLSRNKKPAAAPTAPPAHQPPPLNS